MPRPIYQIATDVRKNWKKVSVHAEPYLNAMASLDKIEDNYYHDDGRSIVLYFLSNAAHWRGEGARRIKAELRGMLK